MKCASFQMLPPIYVIYLTRGIETLKIDDSSEITYFSCFNHPLAKYSNISIIDDMQMQHQEHKMKVKAAEASISHKKRKSSTAP